VEAMVLTTGQGRVAQLLAKTYQRQSQKSNPRLSIRSAKLFFTQMTSDCQGMKRFDLRFAKSDLKSYLDDFAIF
jgi:hypothetical protein